MNDTVRVRRGRGFNAQEVANLRSWGYEPRPDEIEGRETGRHFVSELATGKRTAQDYNEAVLRETR